MPAAYADAYEGSWFCDWLYIFTVILVNIRFWFKVQGSKFKVQKDMEITHCTIFPSFTALS